MAESSKNPHVSLGYLGGKQGLKKNMGASSSSLNGKLISVTARPHLTLSNHEMVFFS